MQEFDLIVIGAGSGLEVAKAAAQQGMKVAIVERGKMGGTCLNRGCIPSKMLIHAADIVETIKSARQFGIDIAGFSFDFEKIVSQTNNFTDSVSSGITNVFSNMENPKLFAHESRFIDRKTLSVGDEIIRADKILIASGSRPAVPKIKGLEGTGFLTSDDALRLKKQPRVLTIIGGGYIAAELAHFFGTLGTKINIIQRNNLLVPNEDEDVAEKFTNVFSKKYNLYLNHYVESASKKDNEIFVVRTRNPSEEIIEIESDQLLVATGRVPNSDTLDLGKTGIEVDEIGFINVDKYLETNVKGIFALGDAVGRNQFKHSANLEAEHASNNIIHPDNMIPVDYTVIPHAVFSSPQIAGVGYTEKDLKSGNIEYTKVVYPYMKTAMGGVIRDTEAFVKFLVSKKDGKILGTHIIGSHASILIHEVIVAMRLGANVDSIARTVHIFPSLSEVVGKAASEIKLTSVEVAKPLVSISIQG
jgi:mycothione reductase